VPRIPDGVELDAFFQHDLNDPLLPVEPADFDYVLALDVIEHLASPESFLDMLQGSLANAPGTKLIISTGNIAFAPLRLMLLLGQFNYGRRGILDLTHTRLLTFATFRRLLEVHRSGSRRSEGSLRPSPLLSETRGSASSCLRSADG